MRITKMTMTGADDSIKPQDLIPISEKYPFVEWGILRSRSQNGGNRFPSQAWVTKLAGLRNAHPLQLCAHLCGKYVREIIEAGTFVWVQEPEEHPEIYDRVQVNFHAERHQVHSAFIRSLADEDYEYIFQMDGTKDNEGLFYAGTGAGLRVHPLFDISGGIGAIPDSWPTPIGGVYCGYAGGLGPDSIVEQLQRIEQAVGDREIWIDMETRIRSDADSLFDLAKVEKCIELALPWVHASTRESETV